MRRYLYQAKFIKFSPTKKSLIDNKISYFFILFSKISFIMHKEKGFHIKIVNVNISNITDIPCYIQ